MSIAQAIQDYHQSDVGYAWDEFWDHKCEVEATGGSLLSEEHIAETSHRLLSYLFKFGMTRKTKLITLTDAEFGQVLTALNDAYQAVHDVRLEMLSQAHQPSVVTLFKTTARALRDQDVSPTITLVTKMHMALWGAVPAYDRLFRYAYRKTFVGKPFPSRYTTLFDSLLRLRDRYDDKWAPQIAQLDPSVRQTRSGGHQPIPVARLIDMAFWQYGNLHDQGHHTRYDF